jgi:hypothetical protein
MAKHALKRDLQYETNSADKLKYYYGTTQKILRYTTVDGAMIISAIRLHLDPRGGLYLDEQKWLETSSVNRDHETYGDDDP